MQLRSLTLFFIGALLVCGCALKGATSNTAITNIKATLSSNEQDNWDRMIGKWYGKQPTKEGGVREWVIDRKADGVNVVDFRTIDSNNDVYRKIEIGEWGISGPIYFTIYKASVENDVLYPVAPGDPYNYDAYQIITLTDEHFTYKSFSTGNEFTVKRVDDTFAFDGKPKGVLQKDGPTLSM